MTELATYIKQFTHLNRAPGATWSEATKHRAPHKPILLLSVLDLVARKGIKEVASQPGTNPHFSR